MPIIVVCACKKRLRAPDDFAGRRVKCPSCGAPLDIPRPEPEPEPEQAPEPEVDEAAAEIEPTKRAAPPDGLTVREGKRTTAAKPDIDREKYRHILDKEPVHSWRDFTYFALLLALLPLVFSMFAKSDEVSEKIQHALVNAPDDVLIKLETATSLQEGLDILVDAQPKGRLEGAHMPRRTFMHWLYALLASGVFFLLGMFIVRDKDAHPGGLAAAGLFTGTVGIVLLLGLQWLAGWTQGFIMHGGGIITLLFWILWAIGFSYGISDDPSYGFVASFFGFTFGVGFCEEVCKALPVVWYYRTTRRPRWHEACALGFASGVGFGVAEAILYSSRYYNGIHPASMYVVRFVSCIALHVIWSLAVALFIHKHQGLLFGAGHWVEYIPRMLAIVSVPMILHGLYDTSLKKEIPWAALAAAVVSFGWLVWQMETVRSLDEEPPKRARKRALA